MENYISPLISNALLFRFHEWLVRDHVDLHSIIIWQGDELLVRWSLEPYSCGDKREIYSESKSFTSTAFGVAFDRGWISPEDKVLSIFPEGNAAAERDGRWQEMTLHHLLTMSTGHDDCVLSHMANSENSVTAFFAIPLRDAPGKRYVYNSGATCLLAEALRRKTGMNVCELLSTYVFPWLGIKEFSWQRCRDGLCVGGAGLNVSLDDVAALGRLYLNRGFFEGTRVLSPKWVDMAVARQIDTPEGKWPDWRAGYGYQFWRNEKQGFRADGAFGQYCLILPEKNMVCAVFAENYAADDEEMQAIWGLLDEMFGNKAPAASDQCHIHDHPTLAYKPCGTWDHTKCDTGIRKLRSNPCGWTLARLLTDEEGITLFLGNEHGMQCISAPGGVYRTNQLNAKNLRPGLYENMYRGVMQELKFVAAASKDEGDFLIECRAQNMPHAFNIRLALQLNKLTIKFESALDIFGPEQYIQEE